jgi:CYTH domain-containing protein
MAKGAALSEGSSGENIQHFSSMRVRVTGGASLQLKVYSLDDVRSKTLVALPVTSASRIIPTRLVNFMEQRASFEMKTTEIDEFIKVNRVVIFVKEVFTSYPGS